MGEEEVGRWCEKWGRVVVGGGKKGKGVGKKK